MRTTVNLDDDVLAEVERRRRESGKGVSEVVNDLARAGAAHRPTPPGRRVTTVAYDLGLTIDVSNVAEALDLIDDDR